VCGHFDSKIIYGLRVVEAERERERESDKKLK